MVCRKATGLLYLVLNPRSSDSTGIVRLSMFSIFTYLPASIARITRSMFSSVPWISMAAVEVSRVVGTIAEAHTLDPAEEGNVFANYILHHSKLFYSLQGNKIGSYLHHLISL